MVGRALVGYGSVSSMDDHERQQLRVELNALFDEGTAFFERLLRRLNECSEIQSGPPKTHDAGS